MVSWRRLPGLFPTVLFLVSTANIFLVFYVKNVIQELKKESHGYLAVHPRSFSQENALIERLDHLEMYIHNISNSMKKPSHNERMKQKEDDIKLPEESKGEIHQTEKAKEEDKMEKKVVHRKLFPDSHLFKRWGADLTEDQQTTAQDLFIKYGYNVYLSDRLPLDRPIPDTRYPRDKISPLDFTEIHVAVFKHSHFPLAKNTCLSVEGQDLCKDKGLVLSYVKAPLHRIRPSRLFFMGSQCSEQIISRFVLVVLNPEYEDAPFTWLRLYWVFSAILLIFFSLSYSCKEKKYPHDLPTLSVILIFMNEAMSIILQELKGHLDEQIKNYNAKHPGLLKIVRHQKREGLTQARISGWEASTADVVAILDAHIEVNVGWAEPILSRIKEDRTVIISPVFDNVRFDDFELLEYAVAADGFDWALWCVYEPLPKEWYALKDETAPVRSPSIMGILAAHRVFLGEIGVLDGGMHIYGGENVELGLRVWQCGGQIEVLPCSRVAHLERAHKPYLLDFSIAVRRNALRVAEV
ncbi:lipase member M-like [Platysternon megacephalum]|uniref:Lipase member M-like n=1 Tax=Platysternon megacephalum TaxID=55544 RepID=A0A4D9DXR6_9SAUR|nr:lipase member M-like [Platysternon megacephalum]